MDVLSGACPVPPCCTGRCTSCKNQHSLWLAMNPDPICFIWWFLGHLLKMLWTTDPSQVTFDGWLSSMSQNLDPPRAFGPHQADTAYCYLRGVWLLTCSVLQSKAMFILEEFVERKCTGMVQSIRKSVLQNWPASAQQVTQWHTKSSSQEHKHNETVLHPEPAQSHRTCCWGEQLAKGMPQLIKNMFNLCLDTGLAEKREFLQDSSVSPDMSGWEEVCFGKYLQIHQSVLTGSLCFADINAWLPPGKYLQFPRYWKVLHSHLKSRPN